MREELKIQNAVTKHATKIGVPWIRLAMRYGVAVGWPDVEFFFEGGRLVFIEFKDPEGELKPGQVIKIDMLRKQGFTVYVCDNIDDGKYVLEYEKQVSDTIAELYPTVPTLLRERLKSEN